MSDRPSDGPDTRSKMERRQAALKARAVALGVSHADLAARCGWTPNYLTVVLGRAVWRVLDTDRAFAVVTEALDAIQRERGLSVVVRISRAREAQAA